MAQCTPKSFDLTGKVALITGASYGIGMAIAKAMAANGATIVFNDIKQELVDKGIAAYTEAGIKAHGYVCDVTDEDAVNAMVATTQYADSVRTALRAGADAIVCGAGLPRDLPALAAEVSESRAALAPIVSSGRAAGLICKLWDRHYGRIPDFLILEGPGAGGHLGFSRQELEKPPTLSVLLPEVLEALAPFRDRAGRDIPVFVAGGVKNGAEMAAYMRQGAAGAQFATRFIVTKECDASRAYKERLIAAEASDITLVKSPVGMPGRALRSPLIRRVEAGTQPPPERCVKCIVTCDGKNAPYCISKALIAARNGDWENGLFFCGENAGEIKTLSTVPAEMARIVEEWRSAQ